MKCTLVAISKPVIEGLETAEDLVAYCARVSNPANQLNQETASKLLKYLADNKHWSPFEMISVTIEIETTRDIARQILRHRSFAFQEFSQRYARVLDMSDPRETRLQDNKNRQNSIEVDDESLQNWWEDAQLRVIDLATEIYDAAYELGIAKEQARVVLPEGLTNSTLYMAGTLRSWIHYCQLRMGNGTQKEHREIAQAIWKIILQQFPSLKGVITDEIQI
jgi:thymidylate synthase (FAD)